MNIMKFIAGTCMPEDTATCDYMLHGAERHERYLQCVVLVTLMILAATAIVLTLYLLRKNRTLSKK